MMLEAELHVIVIAGRVGEGFHTTSAQEGCKVLPSPLVQVTPLQPTAPLFKVTQSCKTGEPTGMRKRDKCNIETASEASDNDGGF